ncbi:hypothetical protein [Streptomyces antimicrobicus]|uniref:Uncharacterized protein n=1 Tax=Streptomyces antimicrobicus TaxID=2883108 RepID=A0ABS8B4I3_9ACTN|nr:hypothetical protein [Streptomyces antimicrobicus]MCB5179502.1 hypothetical protein [Streptomyces antimicrobicus]
MVRGVRANSGLINGVPFPKVGELVELDAAAASALLADGWVEPVAETAGETQETRVTTAPEKRGPGRPRKAA